MLLLLVGGPRIPELKDVVVAVVEIIESDSEVVGELFISESVKK